MSRRRVIEADYVEQSPPTTPVRDYLSLIRVPDTLMAGFGTFVGAHLAGLLGEPGIAVLPLVLSIAALSAASMVFNDWHDVDCDRINRPDRPLPARRIRRPVALQLSLALFLTATVLAWISGPAAAACVFAVVLASVAYTLWLKGIPLLGNLVVGVASAVPLWIWFSLTDSWPLSAIVLTASLAIMNTARETVRTARDVAGDQAMGVSTVASVFGQGPTVMIGVALAVVATTLAWLPWISGEGNLVYLTGISLSSLLMIAAIMRLVGSGKSGSVELCINLCRALTLIMAIASLIGIP